MNHWRQFQENAAKIGLDLTREELDLFRKYTDLLLEANQKTNLTAIRTLPAILTKHYLDSLALLPTIAQTANLSLSELRQKVWSVIDIGSGAGIPGYPFHFLWPSMQLSLVESIQKKAAFLWQVAAALQLPVHIWAERAETLAHQAEHRAQYDLVLARAVAPLNTLIEYTLPFARIDGLVVLPKGGNVDQELGAAQSGIVLLGGSVVALEQIDVPGLEELRTVVIIRKTHATPSLYPRRPGIPAKRPLSPK